MRSARTGDRERGAVAVEAALVIPLLLLILFGIIEFSLAYKASINVSAAVRAGVRTASAEPRQPNFYVDVKQAVEKALASSGQDKPVELWIYAANTNGTPVDAPVSAPMTCTGRCQKWDSWNDASRSFTNPGSTGSLSTTWKAGYSGTGLMQSCLFPDSFAASPAAGHAIESVGIYVRIEHTAIASLFTAAIGKKTFSISDQATARFEPTPAGQLGC